ncbi:hypothetical protein F4Y59_05200 [Candidatus Poribacteria bacterium]|nr:hypothetical protein [Candidatus Poribacteria bacterium]MXY27544.1 hypothetical protein [Candidatus Poribacteria bacterium]MYK17650.1 hypothetical protein [Candidatus Poribacteria bacterium]
MAYSNFTLAEVRTTFQLETVEAIGLFSKIESVLPRSHFTEELKKKVPLATAINTEKARSELIVADVLFELREHCKGSISLFSGIDFNVDAENGLTGVCDFLISLSPRQLLVDAPVIVLVEAKKEDLTGGLGQCIAEMLAAQRFNGEKGNNIPCIYGAVTSGTDWLFLKLAEKSVYVDLTVYQIAQCEKILGILTSMVNQKA